MKRHMAWAGLCLATLAGPAGAADPGRAADERVIVEGERAWG